MIYENIFKIYYKIFVIIFYNLKNKIDIKK